MKVIAFIILSELFILNTAFGNAMMSITVNNIITINESIILGLFIYYIFKLKLKLDSASIALAIWMAASLSIYLPIGLFTHGIWAVRDASNQIDSISYFAALIMFSKINIENIRSKLFAVIVVGLCLEMLDRIYLGPLYVDKIKISAFQDVSLFGGTIGSSVIVFTGLWIGINFHDKNKLLPSLLIIISLALILLHQNRYLYVSLIVTSFVYLLILKKYKFIIKGALLVYVLMYITSAVLNMVGDDIIASGRLIKYSKSNIELSGIIEHLNTGYGVESNIYNGSAGGLEQRIGWWVTIYNKLILDSHSFLLGLGFGIPLTDDVVTTVIREPHNSYVSVFARTGLIMFSLWIYFIISTISSSLNSIILFRRDKIRRETSMYKILVSALMIQVSILITALVEPAFELPPIAISFYIISALSAVCVKQLKVNKNDFR
jgi:hypothetical protein